MLFYYLFPFQHLRIFSPKKMKTLETEIGYKNKKIMISLFKIWGMDLDLCLCF